VIHLEYATSTHSPATLKDYHREVFQCMTSLLLSDLYKIGMNSRDYSIAYFENTAQHLLNKDPRFQVTIEDM